MALNFDPSAYLAAFRTGLDRTDRANQQYAQGMQGIPQGLEDILRNQEQQKQDRLQALNLGLTANSQGNQNPQALMDYYLKGTLPSSNQPSTPPQQPPAQQGTMLPQSPDTMMASAGVSDTGDKMPSPPIQAPMPGQSSATSMSPTQPPQSQPTPIMGSPIVARSPWNKQNTQTSTQNGVGSLFAKAPFDVNGEIKRMQSGDYSNLANLNDKQMKTLEATPAYQQMKRKQQDGMSVDEAGAILNLDDKHIQKLKSVYKDGMIPQDRWDMIKSGNTALSNLGTKEDQQQDKLEQEYRQLRAKALSNRSGGIGLQDAKVNAAFHARQLIDQATDPKTGEIHVNQITNPELAMSLSSLVSGGNAPALETIERMTPESLQGFIKSKIGYIFGKPVDVLPQQWATQLKDMIDRQGATSQLLRDNYSRQLKSLKPTRLAPDRAGKLEAEPIGINYTDFYNVPQVQKGQNIGSQPNGGLMWQGRPIKDTPANRAWLAQQGQQ